MLRREQSSPNKSEDQKERLHLRCAIEICYRKCLLIFKYTRCTEKKEERRTNLLHGTLCLEEDSSTKELAKNATNAPNVHGCCVVSRPHQDFRRAIILRHHFLSHVLVLIRFFHSSQTEVADLFASNTVSFRIIH